MMKQAIFDATVAVLTEHGVKGMTMDRVAAGASMAKGSLYHYFRGKEELLQFVYQKTIEPIFRNLVETIAKEQTAIEKLSAHLRHLLEHVAKHAHVFKLLFSDDIVLGILQPTERMSRQTGCQYLATIFRQGFEEGVFRPNDPVMLAHMFLGLCHGVFDGEPDIQDRQQQEEIHHLILGSLLNGIKVGPAKCLATGS
jgi:AcrR family transcriptional regulator